MLLLALIVIGSVGACGNDDEQTTGATTTEPPAAGSEAGGDDRASIETITVRDGEPVGGVHELEYDAGEQVRFRVRSDAADEVHIHGYDIEEKVPAGGSVTVSFPADIEGIFEIELHESEQEIAELRVNP